MPRKLIYILFLMAFLAVIPAIPNYGFSALFKKPWADLEVDYLSAVVSPDLTYFDGTWSGFVSCGQRGTSPGSSPYAKINIHHGRGYKEAGVKGKMGYVQWDVNILKNGKMTLRGKYYKERWKSIKYSGQIGVDSRNPLKEIMWFKGKRGPFDCSGKLERKLPRSAMKVLAYKIPKLRIALDKQDKVDETKPKQTAEAKPKNQFVDIPAPKETKEDTTPKDITPPQIAIFSHDTSRAISVVQKHKEINIKGRATDQSGIVEVMVNNKEARLDEAGNFDVDIFLGMGKNKIVVRAMDPFENVAHKTFTVTRAAADVAKSDAVSKAAPGRYVALVIGNNNYRYIRKLETAKKDAQDIARILKQSYGFEVKLLVDATRDDIVRAINTVRKTLKENDNLLIYYAGHGEFDKTANKAYWLPVDARRDDDTDWILADRITSNIRRISSKHILVVADSCYSGTLTRRAVTDLSSSQARDHYIKKMQAKKSRTLLASGGNEPVSDTGGKGHSVFAAAMLDGLNQMEKDTFSAEELFYDHIKERVAGSADQTPEYNVIRNSGHEGGDFIFKRMQNY